MESGPGPSRYRILAFYFLFPSVGGTGDTRVDERKRKTKTGGIGETERHDRASLRRIFFGVRLFEPATRNSRNEREGATANGGGLPSRGVGWCRVENGRGRCTEGSLTRRCDFR